MCTRTKFNLLINEPLHLSQTCQHRPAQTQKRQPLSQISNNALPPMFLGKAFQLMGQMHP